MHHFIPDIRHNPRWDQGRLLLSRYLFTCLPSLKDNPTEDDKEGAVLLLSIHHADLVVTAHDLPRLVCIFLDGILLQILKDVNVRGEGEIEVNKPQVSFGERRFHEVGIAL